MALQNRTGRRGFLIGAAGALVAFVPAFQQLISLPDRSVAEATLSQQAGGPEPPMSSERPDKPRTPLPSSPPIADRAVSGVVLEVRSDGLRIESGQRGEGLVRFTRDTIIWKGGYGSGLAVEVGDRVTVRGNVVSGPEGFTVQAERLWSNIVNLVGSARSMKSTPNGLVFEIDDRRKAIRQIEVVGQTSLAESGVESLFQDHPVFPSDGQQIQVVGLERKDGSVLATRLFLD